MRRLTLPSRTRNNSQAVAWRCQFSTKGVSGAIVLKHFRKKEQKSFLSTAPNRTTWLATWSPGAGMDVVLLLLQTLSISVKNCQVARTHGIISPDGWLIVFL